MTTSTRHMANAAMESPLPQVGGGLGWGKRVKIPSNADAASPSLTLPRFGGGNGIT